MQHIRSLHIHICKVILHVFTIHTEMFHINNTLLLIPDMVRVYNKSVQLIISPFEFASDLACKEN